MKFEKMLKVAIEQARLGLEEGGIPIGAALFTYDGELLGVGHNKRIQDNDPATHAETDAFRNSGRQKDYSKIIMVTTLSPCWYCSGLIRQFNIGTVIIGENTTFYGGEDWLRNYGTKVIVINSRECKDMLKYYISENPDIWNEDIGIPCQC